MGYAPPEVPPDPQPIVIKSLYKRVAHVLAHALRMFWQKQLLETCVPRSRTELALYWQFGGVSHVLNAEGLVSSTPS
jgi:hypothetical protein